VRQAEGLDDTANKAAPALPSRWQEDPVNRPEDALGLAGDQLRVAGTYSDPIKEANILLSHESLCQ
jgi:hypothetical protein